MSSSGNKDNGQDKWKHKYFQLLDEQEENEKNAKANEDLLCKTIIRFALAVKGLNRGLDPHLDKIRDLLKNGIQSRKLQHELEAFSKTLMALEDPVANLSAPVGDIALLFEFLGRQYPEQQALLDSIYDQYEGGAFADHQALFTVLAESIAAESEVLDLASSDSNELNQLLLNLLEHVGIPELFAERVKGLRARLQAAGDNAALESILNDAIALLLEVKQHQKREQDEMAVFLSTLNERLADLGLQATGVNIANEKALKKRNLLDQTVSEQMEDLQKKSASATQLEALKQLVHSRLENIGQQIQDYNRQERSEREEVQRKLGELSERVKEMEAESSKLKSKLNTALLQAVRDPLTLLPNRLAFDERFKSELSRWQRHGAPLSLVLCDIDFFKKINDTYGHKSGDKALIVIGQLLLKFCRQSDFVARIGGEEFAMLLPETDSNALCVANKLRQTVEKASFKVNDSRITITMSFGISQLIEGDDHESVFERADQALYQAKHNGRNQCIVK